MDHYRRAQLNLIVVMHASTTNLIKGNILYINKLFQDCTVVNATYGNKTGVKGLFHFVDSLIRVGSVTWYCNYSAFLTIAGGRKRLRRAGWFS